MQKILTGQLMLILCCIFYLIWWYRGYRPNIMVSRVGGINAVLLLITMILGVAGIIFSLTRLPEKTPPKIPPSIIPIAGIIIYIVLLFVTRIVFHRIVTTELILIVIWMSVEVAVINRLNAAGYLTDREFYLQFLVIAIAVIISLILYVAYYRMDEMKAFYAAMVPLVTEAVAMTTLIGVLLKS